MTNNTSILDKRIIDITPTDFAEMFNNIFDKIVLDSSFANLGTVAQKTVLKNFGPFSKPLWALGDFWSIIWCGEYLGSHKPIEDIQSIDTHNLLLIHGKSDKQIPYTESVDLYEASGGNATLWLVQDAGHVQSIHNSEYKRRLKEFFEK